MDMVDVFLHSLSFIIISLAYNQLAQFKSKRNVGNGTRLSCRRQRIKINFNIQLGEAHGLGDEKKKISIF
jgi:hypothetical protein